VSARSAAKDQRGFALLIALWTLGLLALLVTGLAATGRSATHIAGNLRDSSIAEAAADGGVQQAVFQLRSGTWQPDGSVHRAVIGQAVVEIDIEDENGRINPNFSSSAMLAALLGAVGADPAQARDLASAMVDWRTATTVSRAGGLKLDRYRQANLPYGPPSRPFTSVDEIGQVVGMSVDLLSRLRPYISVYQSGDAGETASSSFLRNVLADATMIGHGPVPIRFTGPNKVLLVRSTAVLADGTRFFRTATVRLSAPARPGERDWKILTWK
jgi:general secretion pathway protein K